jgi:hypothetical protein
MKTLLLSACLAGVALAGCGGASGGKQSTANPASPPASAPSVQAPPLWNPAAKLPPTADIPMLEPVTRVTVHRAIEGEHQFLSGPAIVAHKNRLFACWTNSKRDEEPDAQCLRGRWSKDGGLTWGPVQTVAGDATPARSYGHGTLMSHQGRLWVFAARFTPDKPMAVNMEAFVYDERGDRWLPRGPVATEFWPCQAPQPRPGGGWILGGDHGIYPGEGPAVAIIDDKDVTKWRVVDIPFKYAAKKDDKPPYAVETTLWAAPQEVTAIMRNSYGNAALTSISRDGGDTWSPVVESNFPMAQSKPYSGLLSTGQRYLVCNSASREFLVLAVSRPGAKSLEKAWMLRQGRAPARWPTRSKSPQWSYPWAIEHEGKLYVTYSVAKEDCELTIIPLPALK